MDQSIVSVRDLGRRFREGDGERWVFRGASMQVDEGEFVSLMGPSGSGKSTLLYTLGAMDSIDAGEVHVCGRGLGELSERQRTLFRRKELGFIFQEFNLVPTLTVRENLLLPLELNGRSGPETNRRISWLLERVGLPTAGSRFPETLSGGERQRVAVARALAHEPRLLLADEPTGSLDGEAADVVLDLLEGLRAEHGLTAVVATHSDDVAARTHRVLRVGNGVIRDEGPP